VPGLDYNPAPEQVSINTHYPLFTEWVTSGGTQNQDWWQYPAK
jgi:LruC domain-containing protein